MRAGGRTLWKSTITTNRFVSRVAWKRKCANSTTTVGSRAVGSTILRIDCDDLVLIWEDQRNVEIG
jgi:hypothetical protein